MKTGWTATEKRQLVIFALVAFALPYLLGILLGILMGIGYYGGSDVSVFPSSQMYYPAAGAMLALLRQLPRSTWHENQPAWIKGGTKLA